MTGRRPKLSFCLGLGRVQNKVVRGHLVVQLVKNLPAVWETWVLGRSPGEGKDPSFPSQPEGKIGLPRANPRGRLRSPS